MYICMYIMYVYGMYHGTWAHLNGMLHKSLPFSLCVYMCIPLSFLGNRSVKIALSLLGNSSVKILLSLLGNGSVKTLWRQQIHM
jgi:hypothetical protein